MVGWKWHLVAAAFSASLPLNLAHSQEAGTAREALSANKLPFTLQRVGQHDLLDVGALAVPQQIVDAIKATELKDMLTVTDIVTINSQITRAKTVVFNPNATLNFMINPDAGPGDYIVLAAENLILNVASQAGATAKFKFVPQIAQSQLTGHPGSAGPPGWTSGEDDGSNGGPGQPGGAGGKGKTYVYPQIYVFYQKITVHAANPSVVPALRIEGLGLRGGNGGPGGPGGPGGYGARGTAGSRHCDLYVACYCTGGPGAGGNGGPGGPGGRGGDAGRGGNGASIAFIAPKNQQSGLSKLDISIVAGQAGLPGGPGGPGPGASGGGGGSKPTECSNGGASGRNGGDPNPANLGPGNPNTSGLDGALYVSDRDNSDLF